MACRIDSDCLTNSLIFFTFMCPTPLPLDADFESVKDEPLRKCQVRDRALLKVLVMSQNNTYSAVS